jgi:DNA-binding response OmpR family regulator
MVERKEQLPKRKRILVVEDSPTQALEMKLNLEQKDFAVEIAPHGRLGLDRARTGEFDLIVLDYNLPALNALEIMGQL